MRRAAMMTPRVLSHRTKRQSQRECCIRIGTATKGSEASRGHFGISLPLRLLAHLGPALELAIDAALLARWGRSWAGWRAREGLRRGLEHALGPGRVTQRADVSRQNVSARASGRTARNRSWPVRNSSSPYLSETRTIRASRSRRRVLCS